MSSIIFGCGYLGGEVARQWRQNEAAVYAVTRSPGRAKDFESKGLCPIVGDVTQGFALPDELEQPVALFAVGFDRSSGKSIEEVYVEGLRFVLDVLPSSTRRFIYISSTGVYGQTRGEWVDEDSPCQPQGAGGRACLAAERLLASHPLGQRAIVLRLAGLYGPGRIPKLDDLRQGKPLETNPDGTLNLIHRDDAVQAILAAERITNPPQTYTVSDGQPVLRRDFYQQLATLLGVEQPRFKVGKQGSRSQSHKRVRNDRLMRDFRLKLRYPDYRVGLEAIVEAQQASPEAK